jgi:hypothetical protein
VRVATTTAPDGATTLLLTGTINAASAADLERALACARGAGGPVTIDLGRVRLIDRPMLQFLSDAMERDVRAVNCPAHIAAWLRRAVLPDPGDE